MKNLVIYLIMKIVMFPAMDIDGNKYYLKPMNCPHHHKIYASLECRTYKELPIRLSEYGTCYRYEKSGQLFGQSIESKKYANE